VGHYSDAQGKLTVFRAGVSGTHVHEINLDENELVDRVLGTRSLQPLTLALSGN